MGDTKPRFMRRKFILGATIGAALIFFVAGIIFWGGFNTAMEATNTMTFCTTCHEMRDNVYAEYKPTIHYSNRTGVRATCSDCHVPDPWVHKVIRKIQASGELYHWARGTVDTPEKFDQHRLKLAKRVWKAMKASDSRECRNCHHLLSMNPEDQKPRARKQHMNAFQTGQTCIDCHKGIAHKKVHDQLTDEELEELEKPNPYFRRPIPENWVAFEEKQKAEKAAEKAAKEAERLAKAEAAEKAAEKAAAEAAEKAAAAAAAPQPEAAQAAAPAAGGGLDWSGVPAREVVLFYPGQSSMEWVLNGRDHGGARPFKAGDRCFDCHEEEAADVGQRIVTGEKLEPTPIPGKRGSIPVTVQAAHDGEHLYMRFQWPDTEHAPVPFVEGGKMDPDNAAKLALMFATDEVEYADRAGCWGTCHNDLRTMPDAPDAETAAASPVAGSLDLGNGVTKYITESRTEIEIRGKGGKPRGGWDKLKGSDELAAAMDAGHFMDLVRYNAGSGTSESGHVLAERVLGESDGARFTGGLEDGTWTVVMKRKLAPGTPGSVTLEPGKVYNFGFAIHDDHSDARFHHVSVDYKLGLDDEESDINAAAQ